MLLSTFELLLKPITPNPGTIGGSDRGVLQGYFLNIANPTTSNLRIRLRFNATTPTLNPSQLLTILDTGGSNNFGINFVSDGLPNNRFRSDFTLNAGDTGLFILQPDITTLNPATTQLEVRGFVEIFIVVPLIGAPQPLLVTPEHRGTFLPSPRGNGEFDQLIVSLPTSTGAGLMQVDTIPSIFDINNDVSVGTPFDIPIPRPQPTPTVPPGPVAEVDRTNGSGSAQPSLPQILDTMTARIEALESRLASNQN